MTEVARSTESSQLSRAPLGRTTVDRDVIGMPFDGYVDVGFFEALWPTPQKALSPSSRWPYFRKLCEKAGALPWRHTPDCRLVSMVRPLFSKPSKASLTAFFSARRP